MDDWVIIMTRVLVIGAGAQGGPCASILSRDDDISGIVLADTNLELARKVAEKLGDKIVTVKVDAGDVDEVSRAADGAQVIINLTLPAYDMNIMEAALRSGAHYVDTSFGEPTLLDIRARDNILSQIIEKRPLSFDREFKDAGLTALLGCGISPGMVNVITRFTCDKLDTVERICIRLGDRPLSSPEVVNAWTPTWSPFRALWGYAVAPTIFEDRQYKKYPIFSCPEEYRFPAPLDRSC
jgi:saccharopine dehydrogenase (NAD+, L-lysine-forming)